MPITGVPVALGEMVCHVTFKLDGVVKFQGDVSGNVSSSNEVFSMGFDLFKWGGDYPNNKKGPARTEVPVPARISMVRSLRSPI